MTFKPRKGVRAKRHIGLVVDDELYKRAAQIASQYDISMKELARQCFLYALENMSSTELKEGE